MGKGTNQICGCNCGDIEKHKKKLVNTLKLFVKKIKLIEYLKVNGLAEVLTHNNNTLDQ